MNEYLKKIYNTTGSPGAFSSAKKLYVLVKKKFPETKLSDVQNWLNKQYTYTIHKSRKLKYKRNPIISNHVDHTWEADLLFLSDISSYNNRKTCILVCIDVVSRYAWGQPMTNKSGPQTAKAFQNILNEGRIPCKLHTDKGKEFYNKDFKQVCSKYNIHLYSTSSDKKAAIAERCIKEIKKLIYRYLSANQSNRYIDELQNIFKTYNSTYHSSIKNNPKDVNVENQAEVLETLYSHLWRTPVNDDVKFQVNDTVRVSLKQKVFTKGYKGYWSPEIFTIDSIKRTFPKIQYKLKDSADNVLDGLFYEEELQKIDPEAAKFTEIDKIWKTKYVKGKKWVLVSWLNEPKNIKRWILANKINLL